MKNNTNKASIGDHIKTERKRQNITKRDMAKELNISLTKYSQIEHNQTDITYSCIEDIAEILKVDILHILSHKSHQLPRKEDEFKKQDKQVQLLKAEVETLKKKLKDYEQADYVHNYLMPLNLPIHFDSKT